MDRAKFFAAVRSRMPSASLSPTQVANIVAVLDGLEERDILRNQAAYILATAQHESDQYRVTEEYASGAAYEGRKDLGNTVSGDGKRFKGRGLVQITGRRNYTDWAKRLGVDLVGKPHLAAELEHAAPILIDGMVLGTFTGKKLSDYISLKRSDFANARRIVNGTDRQDEIARLARKYNAELKAAGYGAATPDPFQPSTPAQPKPSLWAAFLARVRAIFNR